ncbi:MAG: hypothetical protein ACYSSP_11345 [Planctomycetota bacterium]|jgi:hypothetical protein
MTKEQVLTARSGLKVPEGTFYRIYNAAIAVFILTICCEFNTIV